jgi:PhnB protein
MSVHPVAEGYHSVTPLLHVQHVLPLIEFLKSVFNAEQTWCYMHPDGRVVNAEVRIGDSRLWLSEPWGVFAIRPGTHHAYIYVADVDAVYLRALQAGAASVMEPSDQSWGDRLATVEDPSGIRWHIATQKEVVPGSPARYW